MSAASRPRSTPVGSSLTASSVASLRRRGTCPVIATLGAVHRACSASAASATRASRRPQVILSLLLDNAFLIVLAVGMTFVILTGGIDLSVGSVVALSTMIAATHAATRAGPPSSSIVAVLLDRHGPRAC